MNCVEAGWIERTVVVPSGRLIRLVNVTAGWTLVEMTIVVVVCSSVLVACGSVEVMNSVEAG